ncbi:GNAT family N-acetyltransferase [Kiloniella majae]|uniref:GNAT family N-acetyltransferase n=1 Tax=Kiloniella majae TaxID=1938558 RepID=UPI000A278E7E|nr:GNAT family N-acetyltransferase [Kiloniella majae]
MPIDNDYTVKRIPPGDADLYKELRLEGLKDTPEAFGASYRDESTNPRSYYYTLLENHDVFGAYRNTDTLVGIAALALSPKEKLKHKGTLWGMYIKPEARGNGLAKQLVLQIIKIAKETTEEILLTVVASNVSAITLYKKLGFIEYGTEPRALKIKDRYYDEVLMRLPLT